MTKDIFNEIIRGVKTIAQEMDKLDESDIIPVGWDQEDPRNSNLVLLHPIGGCPMGVNRDNGVVNSYGEVFRSDSNSNDEPYPYFLVIDGSIIPSAPGVNPSLTISALAIRCMENLVEEIKKDEDIGIKSDKTIEQLLV